MLAGGVHRSLPTGTRMILTGMSIRNRLAPNVSDEQREGLTVRFAELFRVYLREMGVEPELLDIVDRNSEIPAANRIAAIRMDQTADRHGIVADNLAWATDQSGPKPPWA